MKYTQGTGGPARLNTCTAGPCKLAIIDASEEESKAGNGMIKLKLEVLNVVGEEQFPADTGPITYEHLVFTEKAFWKIDQFLTSMGDPVEPGAEVDIDVDEIIGRELYADMVEGKTSKDRPCMNVAAFITAEAAGVDDVPFG